MKALITGGTSGIGLAIKNVFEQNGIRVYTPDMNELDLSSIDSLRSFCKRTPFDFDLLINNAGVNPIESFVDLKEDQIDETLAVNFRSHFILTQHAVPYMIRQRFGRLVITSSIWSVVSKEKRSIYAATKAALNALTRTLAIELGPSNILVNAIAPGFINTELTRANNSTEELKKIAESLPLKKLAEPSEVAELVYFLCSEKNTFITGQTIIIDGGYTCL